MGMATEPPDVMGRRRAILTDSERELLSAEDLEDENRRYQAVSRVRNKVEDELPRDVEILSEHHPQLLSELRGVVCEDTSADVDREQLLDVVHAALTAHDRVEGDRVRAELEQLEDLLEVDDG